MRAVLQYSGGKDSRAVLHMHRDELDDILVMWCDTGASYPAVRQHMQALQQRLPHFQIVQSEQAKNIKEAGYPSDVVPIHYTPLGRAWVKKAESFRIQTTFDCCAANIWHPMNNAVLASGIKTVIRGQRRDEQYTANISNGHVDVQGITYALPIESWTADEVFAYLKMYDVEIPGYYADEEDSHDCWDCTGYLSMNAQRIKNLPTEQRLEVERRLKEIDRALTLEAAPLKNILGAAQA